MFTAVNVLILIEFTNKPHISSSQTDSRYIDHDRIDILLLFISWIYTS